MKAKLPEVTAAHVVELVDYTLVLKLSESATLSGLLATLDGAADALGDARALLVEFAGGGFEPVSREFDQLGILGWKVAVRRQIPVAWVVTPESMHGAMGLAYRFATWGLLRGSFVEYGRAFEWLRTESPAVRLAMP